MKFAKLQVKNDWEYLTYTHNGVRLDETKGGICMVRWPDGTVEKLFFVSRKAVSSYQDHGNISAVQHYVLWLTFDYRGALCFRELQLCDIADVVQPSGEVQA